MALGRHHFEHPMHFSYTYRTEQGTGDDALVLIEATANLDPSTALATTLTIEVSVFEGEAGASAMWVTNEGH